jgi:exodeoxyribonuclease VII large subunit
MQGSNSPSSVTKALSILDKMNLDVIVLTRGGGSFEDLFSFCHQDIIEEIYQSKTPIISAIGHEIDNVLSDNVADIRCPTPTHAAVYLATINCSNRNKIIYDASQKILDYKNTLVKLNQETNNLISGYNQSIEDKVNKYKILYDNYINSFKNKIISANKTVADLHDRLRANISYQDQSIKTLSQFKSLLESGSIETIKKMKISFIDGEANLYQLIKHYENKQKEIKENQK